MSRLFILFLIALLPLRGWSVERMALQMEGMAPSQQASAQALEGGMSAECALHMRMAVAADSVQPEPMADHPPEHKGCQSCQLCMPLAGMAGGVSLQLASPQQALPLLISLRFASADPARNAKPPIS